MNIITQRIEVSSRLDTVRIWAIGDTHLGNALCDERLLRQTVQEIADDPNGYWIGLGDYADWINRKDPRHRESRLAPWLHGRDDLAMHQRQHVVEMFTPIRGKCLALVKGNHEDTILKHSEVDVYYRLVEEMKTSTDQQLALGVQGFLMLHLLRGGSSRRRVDFYLHHGYAGGRMPGAKALALGRLATHYDFDVALMGHSHVRQMQRDVRLAVNGKGKLIEKPILACVCGTFLRSQGEVEQYGEMKGYPPSDVGCVRIDILAYQGAQDVQIRAVL